MSNQNSNINNVFNLHSILEKEKLNAKPKSKKGKDKIVVLETSEKKQVPQSDKKFKVAIEQKCYHCNEIGH